MKSIEQAIKKAVADNKDIKIVMLDKDGFSYIIGSKNHLHYISQTIFSKYGEEVSYTTQKKKNRFEQVLWWVDCFAKKGAIIDKHSKY